jgi:hypothetical protein
MFERGENNTQQSVPDILPFVPQKTGSNSRFIIEKLLFPRLVRKFSTLYETPRFITMIPKAH